MLSKLMLKKRQYSALTIFCHALIVVFLIILGNIHVHSGPAANVAFPSTGLTTDDLCFGDFCAQKNLGFKIINANQFHSVHGSNSVVLVTETWLRKSIFYSEVLLPGYNPFWQDRSSKGESVAIFTKEHLQCSIALAKSIPKQFDLLVLNIKLSNSYSLSVDGCCRLPSASAWYLSSIKQRPGLFYQIRACPTRWPQLEHAQATWQSTTVIWLPKSQSNHVFSYWVWPQKHWKSHVDWCHLHKFLCSNKLLCETACLDQSKMNPKTFQHSSLFTWSGQCGMV